MKHSSKRTYWGSGEAFVWLSGGALAICLLMVGAMMLLIVVNGAAYFWPKSLTQVVLQDGTSVLGEFAEEDTAEGHKKIKFKRGNRDITGADFVWIDESQIVSRTLPSQALTLERREWGNFYGYPVGLKSAGESDDKIIPIDSETIQTSILQATKRYDETKRFEKDAIGGINYKQDQIRLMLRKLDLTGVPADSPDRAKLITARDKLAGDYAAAEQTLSEMRQRPGLILIAATESGDKRELPISGIVRAYQPNQMSSFAKFGLYLSKFLEFVWEDPRESNTEGGVFPAIFGTVMMVFIMSIIVTPLGVVAAVYLREYAKQGRFVSVVRIAVNNLAGVPSIVFGVFGVGFFIYIVGGSIDSLFYSEVLPTPTYGTGGILWASLTLALLTVPTVIVATEEGLASIPKSLREGSYALGATKFETTWRVVLPALAPSILTGMILAVARAAGEVAPLMVTGVVKLAPALPLDSHWPYLHLDRKFMHLGFHIYDVGFQSPNVDAARPMVFTTTLLLLVIVVSLNLFALLMRNRLRRRFMVSAV